MPSFVKSKHHKQQQLFCTTVKSTLYCNIYGVQKSMEHNLSYHASDADIHIFPTLVVRCVEIVTELKKYIRSAQQWCRSFGNQSTNASLKDPVCDSQGYSTHPSNCWNFNRSETTPHIIDIFCDFWKEVINRLRFFHKALADIEILQNPTLHQITFADNDRHFLNQHRCIKCRWIAANARQIWKLKLVFLKPRYV